MTAPLITSLEQAGEGSRAVDGMLARHFGWHRVEPRFSRNKAGGWIAPEDFLGVNSDGSPRLDGLHGTDIHRDPPRLSQSLDAALALAERLNLNGPCELHRSGVKEWGFHFEGTDTAYSPTPALSVCIAILRAMEGRK